MTWQENLENQNRRKEMKAFITGWIFVILSIVCVILYISLPEYWKELSIGGNLMVGWWLFTAGFFIAGAGFILESFSEK